MAPTSARLRRHNERLSQPSSSSSSPPPLLVLLAGLTLRHTILEVCGGETPELCEFQIWFPLLESRLALANGARVEPAESGGRRNEAVNCKPVS